MSENKVVRREQCEVCQDTGKDNVAVYSDGSKFCFSCHEAQNKKIVNPNFVEGEILPLVKTRNITADTCRFFDYRVGRDSYGKRIQIANYFDDNKKRIAQKWRYDKDPITGKKEMLFWGGSDANLYGQWLWSPNDKLFITVVEGEIDAMSVAQVQGYQYPVVSVPKGAADAYKSIKKNLKYLLGFKYVVLAFDNDEAGQSAMTQCVQLFEPGKVKVAQWPLKDANEMLCSNRGKEISSILFCAKEVIPDSVVTPKNILDKILTKPEFGEDYPWPSMTKITYGFRQGEIHVVAAGTGIGKTEFIKDILFKRLDSNEKAGIFSFEQEPQDTVRRLIGAKLGIKLHLPGVSWDPNRIKQEIEYLDEKIYLYDRAGRIDMNDLFNTIRYLRKAKDVRFFVIDNLAALGLVNDNTRAEYFMNTLKSTLKELNVTCVLVSHVSKNNYTQSIYTTTSPKNSEVYNTQTSEQTDDMIKKPGLDWESGRCPRLTDVEGAGIITKLSDYVWALARNTLSEDSNESRTLRVKALKTRLDSRFTGKVFKLFYTDNGVLEEMEVDNNHSAY
jgi:twinkle protein